MPWKNKRGFWLLALGAAALLAAPSISLIQTGRSYYDFLTGFEPETLRPLRVKFVPHKGGKTEAVEADSLKFSEFVLAAPKAKKVFLTGDFAQWKEEALPLSRRADGAWEILVPLPPGRYHYLFIADGAAAPDPKNPLREISGRRESSVLVVR